MDQYAQGTKIWIPDKDEVWKEAEIISSKSDCLVVKTEDAPTIELPPGTVVHQRSSDVFTSEGLSVLDDLTQLAHLHEPAVLDSLQNRYDVDKIYTSTGPILIAVNPFKHIRGLYEDEVLREHTKSQLATPHVFKTARASYRGICDSHKSQAVLISGESGAGKTETTKHVMRFLALTGSQDGTTTNVEKQVLESNPLLEGFGNARTLRNDNSSRFGKFIELQFQAWGDSPRLCGARIQTYLLEKVRICDQQEGERNYHVLYEVCAAAAAAARGMVAAGTSYNFPQLLSNVKAPLSLDLEGFADSQQFTYLTRSTCQTLEGINDVERFEQRIRAMQSVGIPENEIQSILSTLAAVLNIGNAKFVAKSQVENTEASELEKETKTAFNMACKLLGVESCSLEAALCTHQLTREKEVISTPLSQRVATENRDALARVLYGMVFDFVVKRTNASIGYKEDVKLFVGVLDIFGFECFAKNSFEQLCINFTNERLQHFFILYVFKYEEDIHQREGIPWVPLDFPDNQESLELLQNPSSGIFTMLDEECMVPKGTDQAFCNKILKAHKNHSRCAEILRKPGCFSIQHFAGPVQYASDGFLEKNKDPLSSDVVKCLVGSSQPFVASLFKENPRFDEIFCDDVSTDARKKKRKHHSVSGELRNQLTTLMDVLKATNPHFVRCIKPNAASLPETYDRKSVTEQLRYSGVLQAVQVSRAGFPVRLSHQEVWNDYILLSKREAQRGLEQLPDIRARARGLLEHLDAEIGLTREGHGTPFAAGNTMVFLRREAADLLRFTRLNRLGKGVILIQSVWRGRKCVLRYRRALQATRQLQALVLMKQARQLLLQRRNALHGSAATKIQARARGVAQRRRYTERLKNLTAVSDLLMPSLTEISADVKLYRSKRDLVSGIVPVQQLQVSEASPVTCMCFGQEAMDKAFILLAVACHDGSVVIYKCFRTPMEVEALATSEFSGNSNGYSERPACHTDVAVYSKPEGHSSAVSSICFTPLEDRLFTTSLDKTLRFWDVKTGKKVAEFTDCSPVRAALFLPLNPELVVAANGNAVLRVVNQQSGMVLQKLKVRSEVRALAFDGRGLSLLAGAKGGSVYVLEVADSNTLKFKYSVELDQGCLSSLTFVRASNGQPSCFIVSSSHDSAMVVDCTYGAGGLISNLQVRARMPVVNSVLPLRSCHSRGAKGFLVSGSEDCFVYVYSMAVGSQEKARYLKRHKAPVVSVAVNERDSILASADKAGTLVLWRRVA